MDDVKGTRRRNLGSMEDKENRPCKYGIHRLTESDNEGRPETYNGMVCLTKTRKHIISLEGVVNQGE